MNFWIDGFAEDNIWSFRRGQDVYKCENTHCELGVMLNKCT